MDEETRQKYWAQFVTNPILWKHQAVELAHAAKVLQELATQATNTLIQESPPSGSPEANRLLADMSLTPVAYMLAGFEPGVEVVRRQSAKARFAEALISNKVFYKAGALSCSLE